VCKRKRPPLSPPTAVDHSTGRDVEIFQVKINEIARSTRNKSYRAKTLDGEGIVVCIGRKRGPT
jgi:hypothetical protein